jgi:FMN phosphatase YigB (HAD superfamily)
MARLLLDVDGVIVRDRLLMAHVKENATRYVEKKLPDCKNPRETNALLYLVHGHTAAGLRSFGIDVSDYNDKVYDESLMNHLAFVLETPEFIQDAEIINEISTRGWNVTLFSNAPYKWLAPIALGINDQIGIKCPGPDMNFAYMKPDRRFYQDFDALSEYYYVDDNLKNLGAVRNLSNWRPIHFTDQAFKPRPWCPQTSSIPDLASFLGSNF